MVRITKAEALKLIGVINDRCGCNEQLPIIEPVTLTTGAKLIRRREGCAYHYFVYGYACDNSDITKAMEEIEG